ncbi:hypothetical protein [Bacillus sp. JJ1764]|uniref:hypothetical protein n=1 Tax=Bacillus sp. JJ1764 TaxID=3122964 RepID=UPI002FFDB864
MKIIDGSFYWIDTNGNDSELFSLSSDALQYRWEIIQELFPFSEAIEAFINGKKISSFDSKGKLCNEYDPENDEDGYIAISEILNCYWSIVIV